MRRSFLWCCCLTASLVACKDRGRDVVVHDVPEPEWHFERIEENIPKVTLTGIWGRSDGGVFAVGWHGTIVTNRSQPGEVTARWHQMSVPTKTHLTAITGVENGASFGLPGPDGEMFAVGWDGTLLHYHPDPDGDPATHDGAWRRLAGPEGALLTALIRADPACPDYDGDGVADDGDGDGWSGNYLCVGGNYTDCDDNCRLSSNGPERPLIDENRDGCLGVPPPPSPGEDPEPADGPDPDPASWQRDTDGDGVGAVCDEDKEQVAESRAGFDATLFGVWAEQAGTELTVIAVGERGAMAYYQGSSAAETVTPPVRPITDPAAWLAVSGLPYRYDDEAGRVPPSCPAQCHPFKTACECESGQCCDVTASTGAGCAPGSPTACGPAENACDSTGRCSTLCADCFRRLGTTLRGVVGSGDALVAVGAAGTILIGSRQDPASPWTRPTCLPTPAPLDERPVLTAVSAAGGAFLIAGSAGSVLGYLEGPACPIVGVERTLGTFYSGVFATGGQRGYVVGDRGVLLELGGGGTLTHIEMGVQENLAAITVTHQAPSPARLWIVGAHGLLVRGSYD